MIMAKHFINAFIILALLTMYSCNCKKNNYSVKYPDTKTCDTVDVYFGNEVPDPYRWLEDDFSAETAEWVKAENAVTDAYMEQIPYRKNMEKHMYDILNYPKESMPWKEGRRYFFYKNNGLQNQSVLYYKNSIDGEEIELLDPNKLSGDGTVALSTLEISDDGNLLGYAISRNGSDWQEIYVKNIETGETLADHIEWAKFSGIAWYQNGFFYNRYPKPENELSSVNTNSQIYYHKIGTEQAEDILTYEDKENTRLSFGCEVINKRFLVIYASESTSGNSLYYKDLTKDNSDFIKIVTDFDYDYSVIDEINNKFIVRTNYFAPQYKLIEMYLENPDPAKWLDLVPESRDAVLTSVSHVGGVLITNYMKDARSTVRVFDESGNFLHSLDNDIIGTIDGFGGDVDDDETFYSITSYITPGTIYHYDIKNNKSELYKTSAIKFNCEDYVTDQKFYKSKDGTVVSMFITHKKDIKLDGTNPTLLYGYGGFNISLTPGFSATRVLWLEQGGVYAVANLRGGGEYGEDWHKAGTKMHKQNVFDDFIAAAEYLISENYTCKEKLAIQGGSNGGLLIGAVVNQRPDLFAVAIPQVGVMDMLRYHKFTIGDAWAVDYGTSDDSEEMFKYIYAYSPVHTVKSGLEYPAILVTTGDHDDRVVPAHSFKYAAALQNSEIGNKPHLIRIESNAGHGGGKPLSKAIAEIVDIYSFIFYNMGVEPKF